MSGDGRGPAPLTEGQAALERFAGKVVVDPGFRLRLIDDPAAALRDAGIELSSGDLQALTGSTRAQREQMLAALQERTAPWAWGEIFVPVIES